MELDNIKLDTTWNDAAGSLNNNFSKLKLALSNVETGGLTLEEVAAYLDENGYINELTRTKIAEALGSEGNEGKYLVATDDGLGWEEAETPDWNASEGEEGFIKNKTHGFGHRFGTLVNNGDSILWNPSYGYNLYIVVTGTGSNGPLIIEDMQAGTTYRINNGPPTDIEVTANDNGTRTITLIDNYGYHPTHPVNIYASVKTLPDYFIPDTIARVSDIGEQGRTPVLESWDDYDAETSKGYALGANLGYEYIKGVSDFLDEINGSTVVAVDEINGEII